MRAVVNGEVGNDEIATAYEYAKGQYVIVEAEELEKLHPCGGMVRVPPKRFLPREFTICPARGN